jgi:hypothetical protein
MDEALGHPTTDRGTLRRPHVSIPVLMDEALGQLSGFGVEVAL